MTAQEIRTSYLEFFKKRQHQIIPRALLVPQNDPTTLFTGSGMQPLIPYLLGDPHPNGKRLVNSQTCLRAQDIEEVGDNRHTTFFEMLGNWSLGDYFKGEEIPWLFEFLTDVVGLDPSKLYISCYIGNKEFSIPKDSEAAELWSKQFGAKNIEAKQVEIGSVADGYANGMSDGRIFFYDGQKNWWSRAGDEAATPLGDPCGPDTEVFYDFGTPHDSKWGKECHPNCDCGRFIEIANSVFMAYKRGDSGFQPLDKPNVDFGGGLERIALAAIHNPDVFKISLLAPIITKLEEISGKNYDSHTESMRVIADHLRAATFLAVDGVVPGNKEHGYVMRRLLRRAIRQAFELGIEQNFLEQIVPVIADLYKDDLPEVAKNRDKAIEILTIEEKVFRQTLRKGANEFAKSIKAGEYLLELSEDVKQHIKEGGYFAKAPQEFDTGMFTREKMGRWAQGKYIDGETMFKMYDTYGYPIELIKEEAFLQGVAIDALADVNLVALMEEQRQRSRTAIKGEFKGGLGGQTEMHKKYHTATHLLYESLRRVLGDHIIQHGSNITEERLRFDFSHPEKLTAEQIKAVEDLVNQQIDKDLKVSWEEHPTKEAIEDLQVLGAFGDRYGDSVKIYRMQADGEDKPFSLEICGGPHVEHTSQLGEDGKRFKITKEESSSAGIRRIKAVLS